MSYSSAHAELKLLEKATLARSRVVENSLVFEAAKDHPVAPEIEAVVRASSAARPNDNGLDPVRVLANLVSLGAPVRADAAPVADLGPEEAVAQGLRLTHASPTLARAYPVLLARILGRLDLEHLKALATALNQKQTLGFLLDLTGALANDRSLRAFAQTLRDRRVRRVRDFFEGPHGKHARLLADRRTPPIAKDWNFRMNMDMENFRDFYEKFRESPP